MNLAMTAAVGAASGIGVGVLLILCGLLRGPVEERMDRYAEAQYRSMQQLYRDNYHEWI